MDEMLYTSVVSSYSMLLVKTARATLDRQRMKDDNGLNSNNHGRGMGGGDRVLGGGGGEGKWTFFPKKWLSARYPSAGAQLQWALAQKTEYILGIPGVWG